MESSNPYISFFKKQVIKKSERIPIGKYKRCRIYVEVDEEKIEDLNNMLEKIWGCKVKLVCALSAYGMIAQVISITEEYLNVNMLKRLRNNFGYKYIFLDIKININGRSRRFFDRLSPSNWFLKRINYYENKV